MTAAALFVRTGSISDAVASEMLVKKACGSTANVSVTTAAVFVPSDGKEQTVEPLLVTQDAASESAEMTLAPTGVMFVNVTLWAVCGPRFVSVAVTTRFVPWKVAALAKATSA